MLGLSAWCAAAVNTRSGRSKAQEGLQGRQRGLQGVTDWKQAVAKYEEALVKRTPAATSYLLPRQQLRPHVQAEPSGRGRNDAYIQKAIDNYRKAADKTPTRDGRSSALQYLVAAYGPDKLNDPAKAEPIVQEIIAIEPNEPTNYLALAKIYEDAGRYDDAEAAVNKAKEVKPNDPSVYAAMSGFYNRQGDFAKTIEALEEGRRARARRTRRATTCVAVFYWEKARKDHRLTTAQKKEYIQKGLAWKTRRSP